MQENTNNKLDKNVQENSTVYELPSTSSRGVETFIQENPNKKCIGKLYINDSVWEVGGASLYKKTLLNKCIGKCYVNDSVREVQGGDFYMEDPNR